jgi:hypothetical protein
VVLISKVSASHYQSRLPKGATSAWTNTHGGTTTAAGRQNGEAMLRLLVVGRSFWWADGCAILLRLGAKSRRFATRISSTVAIVCVGCPLRARTLGVRAI